MPENDAIKPVGQTVPFSPPTTNTPKPVGTLKPFTPTRTPRKDPYVDQLEKGAAKDEVFNIIDSLPEMPGDTDSKKQILKDLVNNGASPDEVNSSILVLQGKHPHQEGGTKYYTNEKGIAIPLKNSEKPPEGYHVASIFGSAKDAKDDNFVMDLAKTAWNILPSAAENLVDLAQTGFEAVTDRSSENLNSLKNAANALKFEKDPDISGPLYDTKDIKSVADVFDTKRFDLSPQTIWGNALSLGQSVGEMLIPASLASKAVKGANWAYKTVDGVTKLTTAGKAATVGVASFLTNHGEVKEAAEAAGLEGRDLAAFSTLVTIPIAAIDTKLGLGSKIFENAAIRQEKNAFIREAAKKVMEKTAQGELTQKALDEAVKEMVVAYPKIAQTWAKETAKDALEQGGEESAQQFIQNAGEQLWDNLTDEEKAKFGTDAFSAESFGEYFQNFLAGSIGGGPTALAFNAAKKKEQEAHKNSTVYGVVQQGDEAIKNFKRNVQREKSEGSLSDEEAQDAITRVNAFKDYNDIIGSLDLNDEKKREAFDLSFQKQNLETKLEQIGDPKKLANPLELAQYQGIEKQANDLQKKINEIVLSAQVKEETRVADKTVNDVAKAEEKSAEDAKHPDAFQTVLEKYRSTANKVDTRPYEDIPVAEYNSNKLNARDKHTKTVEWLERQPEKSVIGTIAERDFAYGNKKDKVFGVRFADGKTIRFSSSMKRDEGFRGHFREEQFQGLTDQDLAGLPIGVKVVEVPAQKEGEKPKKAIKAFNTKTGKFVGWIKATNTGGNTKNKDRKPEFTKEQIEGPGGLLDLEMVVEPPVDLTGSETEQTEPTTPVTPNINAANAPTIEELARTLNKKGKAGISIEIGKKTPYGPVSDDYVPEDVNGYKFVVSRNDEGNINGVIEVSYFDDNTGELKDYPQNLKVVVDKNSRRKGIATKMFAFAENNGLKLNKIRGKFVTPDGAKLFNSKLKSQKPKIEDYVNERISELENNPEADFNDSMMDTYRQYFEKEYNRKFGEGNLRPIKIDRKKMNDYVNEKINELRNNPEIEFDETRVNEAVQYFEKEYERITEGFDYVGYIKSLEGKSNKEILETIKENLTDESLIKTVDLLINNVHKIKTKFKGFKGFDKRTGYIAYFDEDSNTLHFNDEANFTKYDAQRALLHEYVHAYLTYPLWHPYFEVDKKFKQEMTDIFNKLKANTKYPDEYGFYNVDEFASELMSNVDFVEKIKSDPKTKGLFERIIDAFLRWFGVERNENAKLVKEGLTKIFSFIQNDLSEHLDGSGGGDGRILPMKSTGVNKFDEYRQNVLKRDVKGLKEALEDIKERLESEDLSEEEEDELIGVRDIIRDEYAADREAYKKFMEGTKDLQKVSDAESLEGYSLDDLIESYNMARNYDGFADKAMLESVKMRIAHYMNESRRQELRKFDKFIEDDANKKDLSWKDVWFKTLGHMTQEFPELQKLSVMFDEAYLDMQQDRAEKKQKLKKLADAVIKEKNKQLGLKDKALGLFSSNSARYFEYMDKDGKFVTDTSNLSKAQVDLLNYMKDLVKDRNLQDEDGNRIENEILKLDKGFQETYKDEGFFQAFINYLGGNLADTEITFTNPITNKVVRTTYEKAQKAIIEYSKKGIAEKGIALLKMLQVAYKAKKNAKGNSQYAINYNGQLTSKFDKPREKGNGYSKDFYNAAIQYIDDITHVKHMSKFVPIVDSIEYLNANGYGEQLAKPNVVKWLKEWKEEQLYKKPKETDPIIDGTLRFFRTLTSQIVMGFNVSAGLMNVFMGNYNNWRKDAADLGWFGLKSGAVGNKRFFSKKGIELVKKYQVVNSDEDSFATFNVLNGFANLGHAVQKYGEMQIQGTMFLSQLTDKEWDSFEIRDGELKVKEGVDEKALKKKFVQYKNKISDVQGKYSEKDRRNFMRGELGKIASQFKVWMPDAWKERFGREYIDANGNIVKGSWRPLIDNSFTELKKQVQTKEFWQSKEMQANLRGAMAVALVLIAKFQDDDDEKKRRKALSLDNALGNLLFVFDTDQLKYTVKNPVAAVGTVNKFIDILQDVQQMDDEKLYKDVQKVVPYGKVASELDNIIE